VSNGAISNMELKKMWKEVSTEISKAVSYAKSSPYPDISTLNNYVYKEGDVL
jgi:TPP-dependent pyruvate/acetoin dehydrogenase alpha subunit